jgi:hypothetical protein
MLRENRRSFSTQTSTQARTRAALRCVFCSCLGGGVCFAAAVAPICLGESSPDRKEEEDMRMQQNREPGQGREKVQNRENREP